MTTSAPKELLDLIRQGEGPTVEFKKSDTELSKDVYETVCAFSNHDGGHIFLGVKDNGNIVGIQGGLEGRMKKEFVVTVNNASKISPALFVTPEEYDVDGKTII
ncbi:MAG: ATP-binding protein, partial [Clostridia bacterium]|nr:ATP-binding protein [Clostridia bacterium]